MLIWEEVCKNQQKFHHPLKNQFHHPLKNQFHHPLKNQELLYSQHRHYCINAFNLSFFLSSRHHNKIALARNQINRTLTGNKYFIWKNDFKFRTIKEGRREGRAWCMTLLTPYNTAHLRKSKTFLYKGGGELFTSPPPLSLSLSLSACIFLPPCLSICVHLLSCFYSAFSHIWQPLELHGTVSRFTSLVPLSLAGLQ